MVMKAKPFPPLPEDTARVARLAFRKGNRYLTIGDKIGHIFEDEDFADLYDVKGSPSLSPCQLVLVLIFQALENLSDRAAAEAVRGRIEWKYALHLKLEDPGFDFSVLSEFRDRLIEREAGPRVLDRVLERLATLGLFKKRGRQRTDSSYVLSATQTLNRLELVIETVRGALEAVAKEAPDWLREIAQGHWLKRYSLAWRGRRLPSGKEQRQELATSVGEDGVYLLEKSQEANAPAGLSQLPALVILAKIWEQQYEKGTSGWQLRPADRLPVGTELIRTPHDLEARYSDRKGRTWTGYQVHFSETCEEDYPRLITQVEVRPAPRPDFEAVEIIHKELKRRELLPGRHLVDAGYMTGHTLGDSREVYGVELVGPIAARSAWQAKQADGFTSDMFQIDRVRRQAICPEGQISQRWSESKDDHDRLKILVGFPAEACQACGSRSRCTRSKAGRSLKIHFYHEALTEARQYQQTDDFKEEYAQRAGVEGTVSEAVRTHGARRSRYIGLSKTKLQEVLLAVAINLERSARWLMGEKIATTRVSHLSMVMATS